MESSLSLQKSDYLSKTGRQLGYGMDPTKWSANQSNRITDCVESCLRRFYHCGYNWSFLKPWLTLTLQPGDNTITMPDDFGGLEGQIAVSDAAQGVYRPIEYWNPGKIEQMYSDQPGQIGQPVAASLRTKKVMSGYQGQHSELFVFPTADQAYTFRVQYYILPDFLDGTRPFAYGGAEHVETILIGALAISEERYENVMNGPQSQAYQRALAASQEMDRRKKPQKLGRNADHSDDATVVYYENLNPVTYVPGTPVQG